MPKTDVSVYLIYIAVFLLIATIVSLIALKFRTDFNNRNTQETLYERPSWTETSAD